MGTDELILDRATLASQLKDADRELCEILIRYAEHLLTTTSVRRSLISYAQAKLRQSLLSGDPQLRNIAREMGIGTRTLQRKLKAQGTSFRGLISKVRRELAEQYLRDSELGISEVAYLLGYSQPSEFHRAFRVWAGTTPAQYRAWAQETNSSSSRDSLSGVGAIGGGASISSDQGTTESARKDRCRTPVGRRLYQ